MSHAAPRKVGVVEAVVKTALFTLVAVIVFFLPSLIYIAMADTAGAGWEGYTIRDHWYKLMVPAFKWWIILLLINSKVKEGGRVWLATLFYLIPVSAMLFFWMFTDIPMGSTGTFWFREVMPDLLEPLFPDVIVPPLPRP